MSIRILLVDDHKILRDALKGVLEREQDIAVVGEANDGGECLEMARQVQPDIVLMDIGLPVLGGVDATRALVAEDPAIKVVALSTFSDRRIVMQMLDAGARGYVVKSAGRDELLRAIRAVAYGRTYLCPDAASVLVESLRGKKAADSNPPADPIGRREREVLQLLADGHTSAEIGKRLHIATSTVEVHRRNLMRKLELHSIAELTKYAVRHGLTTG
jgi:two-component system NarL family response regulator